MKEIAFFLLPLGGLLSFLLCLPIQCVQRACISFASLQLSLGRVSLRLSATCFLYSLLRFVHVCTRVARDASPHSAGLVTPGLVPPGVSHPHAGAGFALDVRRQAQVLRHQRNFWITLSAVFVWLFVWWLAKLLRWYWRSLEAKQKEVDTLRAQVALFTRGNASARPAENDSETAKKGEETAKKGEETAKKGEEKRGDAERDGETLEKNSEVEEVELTTLEIQKADGCREEKNEGKERAESNETRQRLLCRKNADARTLGVID